MAKKKEKITSAHIKALLKEKFWDTQNRLVGFEVANCLGFGASRRLDAVSMELLPSKDFKLIGYEIKVSRADWLCELRQPEKSHYFTSVVDEFYLVAPSGVLKPGELPKGWGYIKATDKTIRTKIKSHLQKDKGDKGFLDRVFVASLLRNLMKENKDDSLTDELVSKAREEGKKSAESSMGYKVATIESENKRLRGNISRFEEMTGISLNHYNLNRQIEVFNLAQKWIENRSSLERCREMLAKEIERKKEILELMSDELKEELKKEAA